jgi:hypothetical protein
VENHEATLECHFKTPEGETMPKENNIDFLSIIKEVFDPVFKEYGFTLNNELVWDGQGEDSVTASKDGMDLVFYIGVSQLFYYCSVGIKLSDHLAEKVTSRVKHRSLGVTAIAKALDPSYKARRKAAQTREEAREMFEAEKEALLKYCTDILSGDVSTWYRIVKSIG